MDASRGIIEQIRSRGHPIVTDIDADAMEQVLKLVYGGNTGGKLAITIVDAGRNYRDVAALRMASIVLMPTDGAPIAAEVTKQQIEELHRLNCSPRFVEVLLATPGKKAVHICKERCSIAFDWNSYLAGRSAMKPQCLGAEGGGIWGVEQVNAGRMTLEELTAA